MYTYMSLRPWVGFELMAGLAEMSEVCGRTGRQSQPARQRCTNFLSKIYPHFSHFYINLQLLYHSKAYLMFSVLQYPCSKLEEKVGGPYIPLVQTVIRAIRRRRY